MATSSNESLSELERRSEQTRAELAQTVDALHNRVSPGAIKADVKNYVRDNPLQAAAIAVGAAYPIWRMISAMPAPVLLIGAGLAMARRNGGQGSYGRGDAGRGSAGDGVLSNLKDKAADLTSGIAGKAHDTMDSLRDKVSDTTSRASGTLSSAYETTRQTASDTMRQVGGRASETYAQATEQLSDIIERHPILVGGVAFAVGTMVAAAVPVSRTESRLMGETAEDVRRRSEELAMQGLRQAKDVARQAYETASEDIRNEGLTPEAARRAARSAVDTAREAMAHGTSGNNPNRS